jgi:hypothetical protein
MAKCVREMGYWPDRRENKRHLGASFRVPLKASSKGVSVATMMRIPWTWARDQLLVAIDDVIR